MTKRFLVGVTVGAILLYLSLRNIAFGEVFERLREVRYGYILPAVLILASVQYLRSHRWGVLLRPLKKVDRYSLLSVTCVGFLLISIIPARLGELARPYLISKKTGIRISPAIGSIIIERLFDFLSILVIFMAVGWSMPLPAWLTRSSMTVMGIVFTLASVIIFITFYKERFHSMAGLVYRMLPENLEARLRKWSDQLFKSFAIITEPVHLARVAVLSIFIWSAVALAIYLMFKAVGLQLPLSSAFVLLIILVMGIAIPTAPGFVGNWHYACIVGLSLFGIPKTEAMTFAVLHHFVSVMVVLILGLVFLPENLELIDFLKEKGEKQGTDGLE